MHPRYISVSFSPFIAIPTVPSLVYHIAIAIAILTSSSNPQKTQLIFLFQKRP